MAVTSAGLWWSCPRIDDTSRWNVIKELVEVVDVRLRISQRKPLDMNQLGFRYQVEDQHAIHVHMTFCQPSHRASVNTIKSSTKSRP